MARGISRVNEDSDSLVNNPIDEAAWVRDNGLKIESGTEVLVRVCVRGEAVSDLEVGGRLLFDVTRFIWFSFRLEDEASEAALVRCTRFADLFGADGLLRLIGSECISVYLLRRIGGSSAARREFEE